MKKNEKRQIIIESLIKYFLEGDWTLLTNVTLVHLLNNINVNNLSDEIISNNEIVYQNINFSNVNKDKILRLITRNIKIIDYIDIKKNNFTIKELKYFFITYPYMVEKFGIELDKLNKENALVILKLNVKEYYDKINIKKYDFNAIENFEILKNSNFDKNVFFKLSIEKLRNYHIADILKSSGDKFIDFMDLNKLTAKKWCDILEFKPELIKYCNMELFNESDIFNAVRFIEIFHYLDYSYLIKERENYINLLSPLGWEKLIISKPKDFIDECPCYKLNETNWKNILYYHPELIVYKS